jgi:hypothetical protein
MPNRRVNRADALARVEAALRAGVSRRAAAAIGGIDHATLYRWLEHSDAVTQRVQTAEAQAELQAVVCINRAIQNGAWRAAVAWLERRHAQDWRLRTTLDVDGSAVIDVPSLIRQHLVRPPADYPPSPRIRPTPRKTARCR